MASGWIKLHKRLNNWSWKTDPNTMALWVHLLINANYEPSYFLGHEIPIGSLPTGLPSLSEKTGLTISQIRTSLNKLKLTGEIAVKVTSKFSIISITKWSDYQADDRQVSNHITGLSQASSNTIINKEINNIRNNNILRPEGVSKQVWDDWISHRKLKKARVTDTALSAIVKESRKAGMSLEEALIESCQRGWVGFKAEWFNQNKKGNENGKSKLARETAELLESIRSGEYNQNIGGDY